MRNVRPEISDEVANAVIAGRLCELKDLKTHTDFKVLQMSWVYDLNFPRTFQLVDERRYLEKIASALPRSEKAESIYSSVRSFLDSRGGQGESGR